MIKPTCCDIALPPVGSLFLQNNGRYLYVTGQFGMFDVSYMFYRMYDSLDDYKIDLLLKRSQTYHLHSRKWHAFSIEAGLSLVDPDDI